MKNPASASFLEFQRSYNIILVPVGFEDMGNDQSILLCNFKVYIAVPARIDHRCPATGSDKIGIMGNSLRNNPFKQHTIFLSARGITHLVGIKVMMQRGFQA